MLIAVLGATALVSGRAVLAAGQVLNVPIAFTDVTQLASSGPNAFFVMLNVTASGAPPACATQTMRFVVDIGTDGGKGMMAALMSAQLTGRNIDIVGRGTCDIWGDTESIAYINVH